MKTTIEQVWEPGIDTEGFYNLKFGSFDTNVEGWASEWLAIADAIRQRVRCYFKRCAVRYEDGYFKFLTPRNAYSPDDYTSLSSREADELAENIVTVLRDAGERCLQGEYDPIFAGA